MNFYSCPSNCCPTFSCWDQKHTETTLLSFFVKMLIVTITVLCPKEIKCIAKKKTNFASWEIWTVLFLHGSHVDQINIDRRYFNSRDWRHGWWPLWWPGSWLTGGWTGSWIKSRGWEDRNHPCCNFSSYCHSLLHCVSFFCVIF